MTARTRSRTFLVGAAVAALAAPLLAVIALVAPADAGNVGPRLHEVYMYKVEQHVDLSGEYPDNTFDGSLRCAGNDIALDGMWRIDHVDQYQAGENDPDDPGTGTYNDARDVIVYASYGDDADVSRWFFRMENLAQGNAQVKLFVTCIRSTTESSAGHKHGITISGRYADGTHTVLPAGHNTVDFAGTACSSGEYAVAPGFNFSGDAYQHIFRSFPIAGGARWSWGFATTTADPALTLYQRCLSKKVVAVFGGPSASKQHSHKIPMVFRPHYNGGPQVAVSPKLAPVERRFSCDDGAGNGKYHAYKAMVGAFHIVDPSHVWFSGMDPRPKQRAFRFYWDGSGNNSVYLGAHCVKSRTGKQIKP